MADNAEIVSDDPFKGRRPTSHEVLTGRPWDDSYHDGPAPWDVDEPQSAIVRLASEGGFTGTVLDMGCGTGDNALYLASLGLQVLGVDVAETALAKAREKAASRGSVVDFLVLDAFQLARLGRKFDTVVDCGLFHTFNASERQEYVMSLASVVEDGATVHVLCFSDADPDTGGGPHHISKAMLTGAFSDGWNLVSMDASQYQSRYGSAPAWLATIKRMPTAMSQ